MYTPAVTISELAQRVGTTAYAVRWYEQVGILPSPSRRRNGYRQYTETDVARVRLVVTLRRLGVAADEAGRIAAAYLDRAAIEVDLVGLVVKKREEIGRQRNDLDRLEGELLDLELTLGAAGRARASRTDATAIASDPIRVLFVSNFNAARGPMAEALLRRYGGREFAAESAGAQPRPADPLTLVVLAEIGIDRHGVRSKSYDAFAGRQFDYVITLSDRGRETCPTFEGSYISLHWGFPDPAEVEGDDRARLEAFRRTRTELSARLRPFIDVALRAAGRTNVAASA